VIVVKAIAAMVAGVAVETEKPCAGQAHGFYDSGS